LSGFTVDELRARHTALTYETFSVDAGADALRLSWLLRLEPDIEFRPSVTIPVRADARRDGPWMETLAFNLGMVETISYWKAACPPVVRVRAGPLSIEQRAWWLDLYQHGLGQFFYENDVDFTGDDFLRIEATGDEGAAARPMHASPGAAGRLLLLGGGKDSAVTSEALGPLGGRTETATLNPIPAAGRIAALTGHDRHIQVERVIDPSLLRLNAAGYLNGHTPFSAYLAFLGVLLAALLDVRDVVVSNEHSASAAQAVFHGQPINHQYSKSFRFEQRFRDYSAAQLSRDIRYFSFLRPLDDLRVAELFAGMPRFHGAFRSCNVGQKTDSWCGDCAKCAFVYLSLRPFLARAAVDAIFGRDVLASPHIAQHLRELLGLGDHIPFECVGSEGESRLALRLILARSAAVDEALGDVLQRLAAELDATGDTTSADDWPSVRNHWSDANLVPDEYAARLRALLRDAA
jgi:hypothetical protein